MTMGINGTLCATQGGVAVSEVACMTQSLVWESSLLCPSPSSVPTSRFYRHLLEGHPQGKR